MNLSDIRGEDAIDLLADLMEPASEILDDEDVKNAFRNSTNKLKTARIVLKKHKIAMLNILAAVNQKSFDEYKPNIFELLSCTVRIISDPGLIDFFTSQGQTTDAAFSGSALENTEAQPE